MYYQLSKAVRCFGVQLYYQLLIKQNFLARPKRELGYDVARNLNQGKEEPRKPGRGGEQGEADTSLGERGGNV